ncbi:hypothetical protein PFISCL1PPCAC_13087, partial [Pristionchus fissidentatus]
ISLQLLSHTFYTLNRKSNISAKTKNYHRQMTRSLIIQALIPNVTILLPISILICQFLTRLETAEFVPVMFIIIGTHSIAHSLTLILCTRNYRRAYILKVSI